MKRIKSINFVLALLLLITPILPAADAVRESDLRNLKSKMETSLQNIDGKEAVRGTGTGGADTTYKTLSKVEMKIDNAYFDETSQSSFAKNKVMTMLSQLAVAGAYAIGTAEQPATVLQLQEQASSLSKSNDPEFQALGQKYEKLSIAVQNGNNIEAQTIAQDIQSYVQQNAPVIAAGYQPTKKENALVSGFAGVLSRSLGRILPVLTTFALGALFKALGFGLLAANPVGLAISIILSETIGAVASGIGSGGNVDWTPVGNTGVNQATGLADQGAMSLEQNLQNSLNGTNNSSGDTSASGNTAVAPPPTPQPDINTMDIMKKQEREATQGKSYTPK